MFMQNSQLRRSKRSYDLIALLKDALYQQCISGVFTKTFTEAQFETIKQPTRFKEKIAKSAGNSNEIGR